MKKKAFKVYSIVSLKKKSTFESTLDTSVFLDESDSL